MMRFLAVLACCPVLVLEAPAQEKKKPAPPALTKVELKSSKVLYRTTPQGDLYLHVFYPPDWKPTDRRPAMVFFFGGGWKSGSYTQFVPQAQYFASRGMVTACADYRILNVHKTTPDQCVIDAKAAVRWLRLKSADLGIDRDRIVASGGSAGGHLAAATALVPGFDASNDDRAISCVPNVLVLFNPALNLTQIEGRKVPDAAGKDIAAALSPTKFLKKGAPPALLFFGTADKLIAHGREFIALSAKLGNRAELYTEADMPHGFFNRSPWTEVTALEADRFLQGLGYLKGSATIQLPEGAPKLLLEK